MPYHRNRYRKSRFCLFCEGGLDSYGETWYFSEPLSPIGECDIGLFPVSGVDIYIGGPKGGLQAGPTISIPKSNNKPKK